MCLNRVTAERAHEDGPRLTGPPPLRVCRGAMEVGRVQRLHYTRPIQHKVVGAQVRQLRNGPVYKGTNQVPKAVSERDSALSWFESLILPFVNAN